MIAQNPVTSNSTDFFSDFWTRPNLSGNWGGVRDDWAESGFTVDLALTHVTLGPDHPDVAIDLNNLAGLYQVQGHFAEAEPLHQRALAIHVRICKGLGVKFPGPTRQNRTRLSP